MDSFKVVLEGPAPWGFRLQGGKDFNVPLSISRLTPGGKAAQAGVAVGDWVLSIDGENAGSLTHIEAQNKIRACGERLSLGLSRAQPVQSKQQKASAPAADPPRYTFAPSVSLNKTARPFGAPPPADSAPQQNGYVGPCPPAPVPAPPVAPRPLPAAAQHRVPPEAVVPCRAPPWGGPSRWVVSQPEGGPRPPPLCMCSLSPLSPPCRGRYLVALGHAYHPEGVCVLEEGGFFEEKGAIFCPPCYDVRYAPSCAKCKKKITGEIMHALKMTWHVHCFTCAACKTPIRNRAFYMEEGVPYCERDYEKMFGTKCHGCDFKIDAGDRFLEALGFSWHDTCFVCAICQINLEGKTFYSKKDRPLCKSHAFSHV
uniref:PDZ and LIM domain protein 7 n=1 Tax=Nomascus leucogenys TaxID=61853 RepID=A0A2I3GEN2_NOMLE